MKRDGRPHLDSHILLGCTRGNTAWKIWGVRRASGVCAFDNDEVPNCRPAYFSTLLRGPAASSATR